MLKPDLETTTTDLTQEVEHANQWQALIVDFYQIYFAIVVTRRDIMLGSVRTEPMMKITLTNRDHLSCNVDLHLTKRMTQYHSYHQIGFF